VTGNLTFPRPRIPPQPELAAPEQDDAPAATLTTLLKMDIKTVDLISLTERHH
jgi:hypothetical protein